MFGGFIKSLILVLLVLNTFGCFSAFADSNPGPHVSIAAETVPPTPQLGITDTTLNNLTNDKKRRDVQTDIDSFNKLSSFRKHLVEDYQNVATCHIPNSPDTITEGATGQPLLFYWTDVPGTSNSYKEQLTLPKFLSRCSVLEKHYTELANCKTKIATNEVKSSMCDTIQASIDAIDHSRSVAAAEIFRRIKIADTYISQANAKIVAKTSGPALTDKQKAIADEIQKKQGDVQNHAKLVGLRKDQIQAQRDLDQCNKTPGANCNSQINALAVATDKFNSGNSASNSPKSDPNSSALSDNEKAKATVAGLKDDATQAIQDKLIAEDRKIKANSEKQNELTKKINDQEGIKDLGQTAGTAGGDAMAKSADETITKLKAEQTEATNEGIGLVTDVAQLGKDLSKLKSDQTSDAEKAEIINRNAGYGKSNSQASDNSEAPNGNTSPDNSGRADPSGMQPGNSSDMVKAGSQNKSNKSDSDITAEALAQMGGTGKGGDGGRWNQINVSSDPCDIGFINGLAKEYATTSNPKTRAAFSEYVSSHMEQNTCKSAQTRIDAANTTSQGVMMASQISSGVSASIATSKVQDSAIQNVANPIEVVKEGYRSQAEALRATAVTQIAAGGVQASVAVLAGVEAAGRGKAADAADFTNAETQAVKGDANSDSAYGVEKKEAGGKGLTSAGLAQMITEDASDSEVTIRSANKDGAANTTKAVEINKQLKDAATATAFQSMTQAVTAAAGAISGFMQADILDKQADMLQGAPVQPNSQMVAGQGDYTPPTVAGGGVFGGTSGGQSEGQVVATNADTNGGNAPLIPPGSGGNGGGNPGGLQNAPIAPGLAGNIGTGTTTGAGAGNGGGLGGLSGGAASDGGEKADQLVGSERSKFEGSGSGGGNFASAMGGSKRSNDTGAFDMNALLASMLPKKDDAKKDQGNILEYGKKGSRSPGSDDSNDGSILGPNSNLWNRASKVFADSWKNGRIK